MLLGSLRRFFLGRRWSGRVRICFGLSRRFERRRCEIVVVPELSHPFRHLLRIEMIPLGIRRGVLNFSIDCGQVELIQPGFTVIDFGFASLGSFLHSMIAGDNEQLAWGRVGSNQILQQVVGLFKITGESDEYSLVVELRRQIAWTLFSVKNDDCFHAFFRGKQSDQSVEQRIPGSLQRARAQASSDNSTDVKQIVSVNQDSHAGICEVKWNKLNIPESCKD